MGSLFGAATMSALGVFKFSNFGHEVRKKGKESNSTWEEIYQNMDLSGRTFLITGANSGIGFDSAFYFAECGASAVHLVCRDPERGNVAVLNITSGTGNMNVFLHVVDLSEPKEISAFVDRFKMEGNSLDVLVNNAGAIMEHSIERNSEGIEKTLATNTVGTFLLTNLLIPVLKQSADPRVITVTTGGILTQKLLLRDDYAKQPLGGYKPLIAYARTKRHELALTELWNERYGRMGITFTAMHPGIVDTKTLQRGMPNFHKAFHSILRKDHQGSDTIKWLAVSPHAIGEGVGGSFFRDREKEIKHAPLARTQYSHDQAEDLWTWCCEMAHWNDRDIYKPSA